MVGALIVVVVIGLLALFFVLLWLKGLERKMEESVARIDRESLRLAGAERVAIARADEALVQAGISVNKTNDVASKSQSWLEDHEARIAFCESQLTAKATTAKIVPKATKPNWKQFRSAMEKSTEPETEENQ